MNKLSIENAKIGFRNFTGEFDEKGKRNFVVFLDPEHARALEEDGWHIKWPKERDDIDPEEDTREPFLKVQISNTSRVYSIIESQDGLNTSTILEGDEVNTLQRADFLNIDLLITPYRWTYLDKTGISAYLQAGYFVLDACEFGRKYGIY